MLKLYITAFRKDCYRIRFLKWRITLNISIDWNQLILVIIGAVIGLVTSIITTIVQRAIDKKGKLNIFYKFSVPQGGEYSHWGFKHDEDKNHFEKMDKGLAFVIPMIFEFQNTSNTTRVIRDVSLILCNDENFVAKMIQIDHIVSTKKTGNTVTDLKDTFLGEKNGSYSFVLPPRSIQKQKCEYLHTFEPSRPNEYGFNKLVLRYFDESNKAHYFEIKDLSDLWDVKQYKVDKEWNILKDCKNIKIKNED